MFLAMDPASSAFITAIILVITILLGVAVWFAIKKNIQHFKEEDDIIVENAITTSQMMQSITKHIKKVGNFGASTLMYIDIDAFHELNDLFGEKACDAILREVATRIIRVLPYKSTITRFRNDEFLVFIRDEDNPGRIEKVCRKISLHTFLSFSCLIDLF